jgi:hypothetical protein
LKTIHEYEPSDIKLTDFAEGEKPDPIHQFLLTQILIIGLTGMKPREGDPPDTPLWPMQRRIAEFLNAAQKAGITIAESVPEVFAR